MAWMADAGGPMNTRPGSGAGLGKVFVFAQETVAGVNRLGAGGLGRVDDFFPAQVAVFGRAAANVHRLVTGGHVFGAGIGIGIHRHGFDTHAAGGGGHAAGDFTTVGDQDFGKHSNHLLRTGKRKPTRGGTRPAKT